MKCSIIVLLSMILLGSVGCNTDEKDRYAAFRMREGADPLNGQIMAEGRREGYSASEFADLRYQNESKDKYVDLAKAVKAGVMRTQDTGDLVISITDINGNTSELWLNSSELDKSTSIRSITPY